jgi:hypothetical protein
MAKIDTSKLSKNDVKQYANRKNRLGYTSFIKDHQKINDDYERFLNVQDDSWIDGMDHFFIAIADELGIKKEQEIKKLKKENKKLKEIIEAYRSGY